MVSFQKEKEVSSTRPGGVHQDCGRPLSLPRPGQDRGAASTGLSSSNSTTTALPQPQRWEEVVPGSDPPGAHHTGSPLGLLPAA